MEKEHLSHVDIIYLLNKVKHETIDVNRRKAIDIAIGAVNAVQRALKWNEHEKRQNEDGIFLS